MKLIYSILLPILIMISCGTSKIKNKSQITSKLEPKPIKEIVYITKNSTNEEIAKYSKINDYKISLNNFPAISQNDRVRFLILHYTNIDYPTSVRVLTKKDVSSHYLITDEDNDTIDLLVSEDKRAWHAGISKWEKFENLNDTSIGIEIVNKGFETQNGKQHFFEYPDYQIKKVALLCQDIIKRYNISPNYVLGHSDIAPQRKGDPGPKFPWKLLYEKYNIGAWYEESDKNYFMESLINPIEFSYSKILEIQNEFIKYGYNVEPNGILNDKFKAVIIAFQYHFRSEKFDGLIDKETYAILLALNKKYKSK